MQTFSQTTRIRCGAPRGVTLLEILIVMTIMLMITAATLPVVIPAISNRRMREASRLVSTFISGARSRAIETGRPVGVMFERFNGLPLAYTISYVEMPPTYSGDTLPTKVTLNASPLPSQITGVVPSGSLTPGLVRYGDRIRLDFKGPLYAISSQASGNPNVGQPAPDPGGAGGNWFLQDTTSGTPAMNIPPSYGSGVTPGGVAFQIFRQPVRSSATPLQLPEGTLVDLMNSGLGTSGVFPTTVVDPVNWPMTPPVPFNPAIIFSPMGRVDYVTSSAGAFVRPTAPLFLLIGRRELMGDLLKYPTDASGYPCDYNLGPDSRDPPSVAANAHLLNFWVTVSPQTGHVAVAENAYNLGQYDGGAGCVAAARTFAQSGQPTGGR
jgi:prepilin-type N-terminal cleavage/methylation domain-containing protein